MSKHATHFSEAVGEKCAYGNYVISKIVPGNCNTMFTYTS